MRDLLRLCAFALAIADFTAPVMSRTPGEVQVGETLRNATLQALNGRVRNLSEFRGRPLLINVWASWCGPCRSEMASLERLAWLESAKHFTIIGVSTDDDRNKAEEYLKNSHATISHYIDSQQRMENMLGAERLPLTVLVDAKGRVLEKIYGAQQWDGPEALALIGKSFGIRTAAASDLELNRLFQ